MKTKKVYIWVKEEENSSYQLFRNEDFYGEVCGTEIDAVFASSNLGLETFALNAKSSVLFSIEYADRIEDLPAHSVYGVIKSPTNGVNLKKEFKITNNNGKPLILNFGWYTINLNHEKNKLIVYAYKKKSVFQLFIKHLQKIRRPIMERSSLIKKINKELQHELDFKIYWVNRDEMKGIYNAYHNKYEYEDDHKNSDSDFSSFIKEFKSVAIMAQFDIDQFMEDEIVFFQKQLGIDNQYSCYLKGLLCRLDNRLDNPFDEFVLNFWFRIKTSIFIDGNSFFENLSHPVADTHLGFLKAIEKSIRSLPAKLSSLHRSKFFNSIVDAFGLIDAAETDANPDIDMTMTKAYPIVEGMATSINKQGADELERIFIVLNLSALKKTAQYEIVKIIRRSTLAKDFQVAYNEFRNKNDRLFNVDDLHFFYFKEKKATVLSEQDVSCEYGAFRKTYHFNLSLNQLNLLYSKLRDIDCLDAETDIRDLASNLIGKFDGSRQANVVDWKGKKTDLAIIIGVLMDYYDSNDSWSCSERLFTCKGEDLEWGTLNVLYNRYKNQPPRTPNKVKLIMEAILNNMPT